MLAEAKTKTAKAFQSTLSQGERLDKRIAELKSKLFQSTLSQGERPRILPSSLGGEIFQSTLSQGERPFFFFVPYRLL